MNRKILGKLLVIILLLIMVINNISYAVNITKDDLKKSINKIFGSDIEIETTFKTKVEPGEGVTIEGDGTVTSTSTSKYESPAEVTVTDNQIVLKEIEDGQEMLIKIDYTYENNKATYSMKSTLEDFGMDTSKPEEAAFLLIAILMMQSEAMGNSFLASADSIGIDLNLAHSYYSQIVSFQEQGEADENGKYSQEITSDIFNYTLNYDQNTITVQSAMEVDMDKLSKIDNSYLNGNAISVVKLTNTPQVNDGGKNETNNVANNTTNNTVNNTTNNMVNNTANNVVNNTSKNTTNNVVNNTTNKVNNVANNTNKTNNIVNNSTIKIVDDTTSNKKIPAAGDETIYFIVLSMVVISLLIYVKLRKYDDIK